MIRIGILGGIGSGKSYVAKCFGYPVFNADLEVSKIYKKHKQTFKKLKKTLPKHFKSFPINKIDVVNAILENKSNLGKIVNIVHLEIKKRLNIFLKKNEKKRFVILDIPLLLENKINKKQDILIYVQSKKTDTLKRLIKRKNFNKKLMNRFRNIQLPLDLKRKKSKFIINNNFTKKSVKISVQKILKIIL